MEIKIIEHKDNPLLDREEYWIKLGHEGKPTPTRRDILSFVSKELKSKEDLIIIDKIFSSKGEASSKVKVFVYKKKDSIPKYQLEKMKRRMKAKGEKEAKEKPVSEEGAEKKSEETLEGQQGAESTGEQKSEETKQEEKGSEKSGESEEQPQEEKKEENQ